MVTGKTIGELTELTNLTPNTKIPVELSGDTYHINYSSITPYRIYRALVTHTGPLTFFGDTDTPLGGFILGETYTIEDYFAGDDFSNIAEVLDGVINDTGCVFKVTGSTSTLEILADTWIGSVLTSSGNVIMNVIENTLGFNLVPDYPGIGIDGVYLFFSDSPTEDIFNPKKSSFTIGTTVPYGFSSNLPLFMASIDPLFFTPFLYVIDVQTFSSANFMLYNTPIEIKIYN